jgi:hypothetical protein
VQTQAITKSMMIEERYTPIPEENEDDYEFWERVAIMRFDGGLTETQAIVEAIKIFRQLEIEKDGEVQKQTL